MPSSLLIAAAISLAIQVGLVSTLLGGMRAALMQRFGVPEEKVDRLSLWLNLAWIFLMPLAGWLVDAWGCHTVTFYGGCLMVALAIAWFALAQNWDALRWGLVTLALGNACLTVGAIRLFHHVSFTPRTSPEAALTFGFVFVGLAAILNQAILPRLLARAGYLRGLLLLALGCLIPAALVSLTPSGDFPSALSEVSLTPLLDNPRLWLLAAVIFLFFPIEHSLDAWPKPYLAELGYGPQAIPLLLAGFWACFLLMRLAMGYWFIAGYEFWMLMIMLLISSMVLGNLVGAYARSSGYFGFWLVGACYGPLLPAYLGATMETFKDHGPALGVGLMLALDSFAALAIQPWFNRYLQGHTARATMRIPMLLGLVMAALTLVLALIRFQ